ncbi:MAG: flavin reductase [Bradymonadales bacterium]|jgi:flavin reductase (DIM6/NTAB) family NADH-FMN oxidoreductase RutF/rubredoxin
MDMKALFKIGYGLYILASRSKDRDNGCIINTVMQVTEEPLRLVVAVSKSNLTHDMIVESGRFTLSVLTEDTPFELIKHFGYQSGRDVDKFEEPPVRCERWGECIRLLKHVNASLCCKISSTTDLGTHTLFLADVLSAEVLGEKETLTYSYYQSHVKPKPRAQVRRKTVFHCRICGFELEADELPEGYICPICKHGVEAFDKIEPEPASVKTKTIFHCRVCGFELEADELPDGYICPICKKDASFFDKLVVAA